MSIGLQMKYRYSCQNLDFLDSFSKNNQIPTFMKICPVAAQLFNTDGRTDMTKIIVAFRNFANAPKNLEQETFIIPDLQEFDTQQYKTCLSNGQKSFGSDSCSPSLNILSYGAYVFHAVYLKLQTYTQNM